MTTMMSDRRFIESLPEADVLVLASRMKCTDCLRQDVKERCTKYDCAEYAVRYNDIAHKLFKVFIEEKC